MSLDVGRKIILRNLRICFMNKIRNQPSNNQYVTLKKYAVLINNSKNLAQLKKNSCIFAPKIREYDEYGRRIAETP